MKTGVVVGLCATGALVLGGLIYFLGFDYKSKQATITGTSWERSIVVEELRAVTEEAWELPVGARVQKSEQRFSHYNEVEHHSETITGKFPANYFPTLQAVDPDNHKRGSFYTYKVEKETTLPDGSVQYAIRVFEPRPVTKTWYAFEVDRWVVACTESDSGTGTEARWPQPVTHQTRREGKRSEKYTVTFKAEDGTTHTYTAANHTAWLGFKVGEERTLSFNRLGSLKVE